MNDDSIYDFYIPKYMDLGVGSTPNINLHNYYLEYALLIKENQVLEIGYGSGLLTTSLLKKGIKVIAIDKSKESAAYLTQKCKILGLSNNLMIETGDVNEYNCNLTFNTIFAADDFLPHFLSKEGLSLFFRKITQLLNSNGAFVTDIRIRPEGEFSKLNSYPVRMLNQEVDEVKYVSCSSWINLTSDNIVNVNYRYEELNSQGVIINSFIRILRQGNISLDEMRIIASNNGLALTINDQANLDCHILQFTKLK